MQEEKKERKKFTKILRGAGAEYYVLHLRLLNVFLEEAMTETEIMVLASFMAIENPIAMEDRFNAVFRREVSSVIQMKANAITFHLGNLKRKGVIKEDAIGRLFVWKILWPDSDFSRYEFVIENTERVTKLNNK